MNLYNSDEYMEDIRAVLGLNLPWNKLNGKSIMLSGSTGLIGSFLVDVIMEKNISEDYNCTVYALGRSEEKAKRRFSKYNKDSHFIFISYDVKTPLVRDDLGNIDYILHLASNTHPLLYAKDPIGTITTNIIGVQSLLEFSVKHHAKRFVFASSNEIYGENRGDAEFFHEKYCGYIDCNTLRAGYPESKRCSEALCQAYKEQKGLDVVIARFTRSYGPTMEMTNTRALSQFIKKAVDGENIVLKSAGTQYFSYTYMADAVSGLLWAMLTGTNGEAYNIAEYHGDIMLRDLAQVIADISEKKVVFEMPDAVEAMGYSKATKARLDGHKLMSLGWKPQYDIKNGMQRTIKILKDITID